MWEGIVTNVDAGCFTAILYDLERTDLIETGEFKIEVVEQEDVDMVKPGAVFTWGVENSRSRFRFLREGKLSEEEFVKRLEEISNQLALFSQPRGPSS